MLSDTLKPGEQFDTLTHRQTRPGESITPAEFQILSRWQQVEYARLAPAVRDNWARFQLRDHKQYSPAERRAAEQAILNPKAQIKMPAGAPADEISDRHFEALSPDEKRSYQRLSPARRLEFKKDLVGIEPDHERIYFLRAKHLRGQ